jgi:hypothetical protein
MRNAARIANSNPTPECSGTSAKFALTYCIKATPASLLVVGPERKKSRARGDRDFEVGAKISKSE